MKPLPSIDWPAQRTIDRVTSNLVDLLGQLADEAEHGLSTQQDYAQLRANILWLKTGYERAERTLIDARERARSTSARRKLGAQGAEESTAVARH